MGCFPCIDDTITAGRDEGSKKTISSAAEYGILLKELCHWATVQFYPCKTHSHCIRINGDHSGRLSLVRRPDPIRGGAGTDDRTQRPARQSADEQQSATIRGRAPERIGPKQVKRLTVRTPQRPLVDSRLK
jgi:hypothetical protein